MEDQRRTVKLAILFLLLQSALAQLVVPLSSHIERAALLDLRSSLGLRSKDWAKKSDPCSFWVGIKCQNGQVVEINISSLRRTRAGRLNPQFSVDALANFTRLASLNASRFSLPGSIPEWFGQRLQTLRMLDLRSCSIAGIIPLSLGQLTNLNSLYLSDNVLTGVIPTTLGQLSRLSVIDLSKNSLTGSIPLSFSSLGNLTFLDLSSNFLSGSIPPALGTLSNLQSLNLSGNSFSGSIPIQLSDLSRLVDLDLSLNSLSGSLPDLRGLTSLQRMVFGNNVLDGSLLENFASGLSELQFVVLSRNNFSGALPALFWSLPGLRFFDVSDNNFTGLLPNLSLNANATAAVFNLSQNLFYGTLTSSLLGRFSFIDLSDNYFQGNVPDDGRSNASLAGNCLQNERNQRSLQKCTSFYALRDLNFDNFGTRNPVQSPMPGPVGKNSRKLTFILAGVFGGLGFIVLLVLVLVLFLCICRKGRADQRGTSVLPVSAGSSPLPTGASINLESLGKAYTYEQLLQATGDFGTSNLIKHGHSGDLFKGVLEDGIPVVIKKIDVHSFKESYMVELDLFSRASHARLVPLLGHCLEKENEKLLVYKYMPNLDLVTSLYRKTNLEDDNLQSLDWITRLKIAIGAAEALSYLHHECTPPFVHRDVQASSILLDDKFEVRLGSLSEVCTQEGYHQNVITRFLRLPQNSEQGPSGLSSATCSYDVFCFGKLLLQLVTGKVGISMSDDATMKDWLEHMLPYISIYEKELITNIVDPSLIIDDDLLEEVWAMAIIARSCINTKASKRPHMRHILKALENPLKVVREESSSSARLRSTSSRGSWNAALFSSWRHSSSDIMGLPGANSREGSSSLKQTGTAGSQGNWQGGGYDHSSSHRRISKEIFPEPVDV